MSVYQSRNKWSYRKNKVKFQNKNKRILKWISGLPIVQHLELGKYERRNIFLIVVNERVNKT